MTYREIIYSVLDQCKLINDDITITEEHVRFLVDKVRAYLLWQKYKSQKLEVPESNYQMLCLDLEEVYPINGEPCEGRNYLRTTKEIPALMNIGNTVVYPQDFYQGIYIVLVSRERMRYVGDNPVLKNFIYCSINPDGRLYFKSINPQFVNLEKVKMVGVFEDPSEAAELECDSDCTDPLDKKFPLEETLASTVIDTVVKYALGAAYRPADQDNDANDNLSDLARYISLNAKSSLAKQIDNG